jgi:hypothetical protein
MITEKDLVARLEIEKLIKEVVIKERAAIDSRINSATKHLLPWNFSQTTNTKIHATTEHFIDLCAYFLSEESFSLDQRDAIEKIVAFINVIPGCRDIAAKPSNLDYFT